MEMLALWAGWSLVKKSLVNAVTFTSFLLSWCGTETLIKEQTIVAEVVFEKKNNKTKQYKTTTTAAKNKNKSTK